MKMKSSFIFFAAMLITACVSKTPQELVDINAVRLSIDSLMNQNMKIWNSKEAAAMNDLLADDGLFCGSDPSEFWNKKNLMDMWNQMSSDTINYSYFVDKRETKISPDGKSAIVVEQFIMPPFSPDIPMRTIYHLISSGNSWKFDFISWNFIPKNEDLAKLSKALE
jgi:hypothetical protein